MQLTEAQVIATVSCPRCLAVSGRACRPTGARCREDSDTHEARWRKLERELRARRAGPASQSRAA